MAQALASLKGLDEAAVVAELASFLDSKQNTVRRSAIYILWHGGFADISPATAALEHLCSHKEDYTRGMAAIALGDNKIGASLTTLRNMTTNDPSGYSRRCAAYGLGLLGDVAAKPILEKALKDSDKNVRNNAQAALEMLSGEEGEQ